MRRRDVQNQDLKRARDATSASVVVEGTFDKIGRAKNPVSYSSDLVELKGTSVKMLADSCQ